MATGSEPSKWGKMQDGKPASRLFRNKKREYLKDKFGKLATKNESIRDLYRGINEFKRGYQPRSGSRNSSVGIAIGYGLDDRGIEVRILVGARISTSPSHPDRLWGPANLLSNGYRGLFPRGVKLTIHLNLVPRSRKCGSIHPLLHTLSWRSA
jgi:hypothetical protein